LMTVQKTKWRNSDVVIALLIIITLTILSVVIERAVNFKPTELVSKSIENLIVLVAIYFLNKKYRLGTFANIKEKVTWKIALLGSGLCVLLNASFGILLKISPIVPAEFASITRYSLHEKFLYLFYLVGVGPALEEILCRGFFYAILKNTLNVLWAAVISTIIFIFLHGSIENIVIIGILSLILVYVYEKTDSLFAAIFTHSVYNASWLFFTYWGLRPW
jgi:membrane protease YdiL (CAAX protease family)